MDVDTMTNLAKIKLDSKNHPSTISGIKISNVDELDEPFIGFDFDELDVDEIVESEAITCAVDEWFDLNLEPLA